MSPSTERAEPFVLRDGFCWPAPRGLGQQQPLHPLIRPNPYHLGDERLKLLVILGRVAKQGGQPGQLVRLQFGHGDGHAASIGALTHQLGALEFIGRSGLLGELPRHIEILRDRAEVRIIDDSVPGDPRPRQPGDRVNTAAGPSEPLDDPDTVAAVCLLDSAIELLTAQLSADLGELVPQLLVGGRGVKQRRQSLDQLVAAIGVGVRQGADPFVDPLAVDAPDLLEVRRRQPGTTAGIEFPPLLQGNLAPPGSASHLQQVVQGRYRPAPQLFGGKRVGEFHRYRVARLPDGRLPRPVAVFRSGAVRAPAVQSLRAQEPSGFPLTARVVAVRLG